MATGRMITTDISRSSKVPKLSPKAFALFCLMLPHFNNHGKMQANSYTIKGVCCPLVDWLPLDEIEALLKEISIHTSVKYFKHTDGLDYIHSLNWRTHQKLREDRLGADRLPECPRHLNDLSGSSPGVVPPEVEGEGEVEGEREEQGEEEKETQAEGGSVKGETIPPEVLEGQRRLEEKRKARGLQ